MTFQPLLNLYKNKIPLKQYYTSHQLKFRLSKEP